MVIGVHRNTYKDVAHHAKEMGDVSIRKTYEIKSNISTVYIDQMYRSYNQITSS